MVELLIFPSLLPQHNYVVIFKCAKIVRRLYDFFALLLLHLPPSITKLFLSHSGSSKLVKSFTKRTFYFLFLPECTQFKAVSKVILGKYSSPLTWSSSLMCLILIMNKKWCRVSVLIREVFDGKIILPYSFMQCELSCVPTVSWPWLLLLL